MTIPKAPRERQELRGLSYPFARYIPDGGTLAEVADGVFWLRMPLPFSLDHINLWVLDAGDHWAVIDTGIAMPPVKDAWRAVLAGPLAGKPVGRVIVTHYHPDHIGLAGWLCAKYQIPLEITRGEYMLARMLTLDAQPAPPADAVAFYERAGWPAETLAEFRGQSWGGFGRIVHRLPTGFKRLQAGEVLDIGGRAWRVVGGSGHSPEHACLVCDADGLMISGDQVLPRITSNISVYPTEPFADPLSEWLDSIEALRVLDPALMLLPAHNEPFLGLHDRLDQLAEDHARKLDALEAFCVEPRTAYESFGTLFNRTITGHEIQMATGEALAHLHWLERHGRVERLSNGADRFVRR